jgi:hypothetical protein
MPLLRLRRHRRLLLHSRRILLHERIRGAGSVALRTARTFRVATDARLGLRETSGIGEADLRIERFGLLDLGHCVGITAFAIENLAIQIMRVRIVRVCLQHFGQTGVGLLPVALRHRRFDLLRRGQRERSGRDKQR